MKNIGNKMAKGAAWMVFFKISERSIGLVSTIILARLLVPEDFGLVALAMVLIAVLEILGAFSFDIVLIQKQEAGRPQYDTAWTFNVIIGVCSAISLLILAIPAAAFYDEPRLENIIYVLALAPFIGGMENIGTVAFRKELEFHKEFKFLISKKLSAFVVTIVLAFTLKNYWALIAGLLTGRFIGVLLSYFVHPYRPRLSLVARKELFHFSKWLFINNIITFVNNKSGDFIIGKIAGPHSLGLYSVAYEISNLPTTELVAPINRAIFPGYAKIGKDLKALTEGFLRVISVIMLFALPIGLGIAVTSHLFVPILLGAKWVSAVPLIEVLALYGVIQALQSNTSSVYLALGKPKIMVGLVLLYNAILIPALIWASMVYGVYGAGVAVVLCALVILPINLHVLFGLLKLQVTGFISEVWRPLVAALIMYWSVSYFQRMWPVTHEFLDMFLQLGLSVIIGAFVYGACLLVLWRLCSFPQGAEQIILDKIKAKTRIKFSI